MPLPSYSWERRGPSRPPCPAALGAGPPRRRYRGSGLGGSQAGLSPRHGAPAAALGGTNTNTAQGTEGRDPCPARSS